MHTLKSKTPVVRPVTPVPATRQPLPCGLTREELRKIILEQIG